MASPSNKSSTGRGWYSISVDSIRLWIGVLLAVAIAIGAFLGYGYLKRHLTEKEALIATEDSRQLLAVLRTEKGLSRFQDKYERASSSLKEAENLLVEEDYAGALPKAQLARNLASSILDSLRNRGLAGEAEFITVFGSTEFRRGDDGAWQAAKQRDVLEPGDWVRTAANASAVIMFLDGTLFTVRPSTVILVERRRNTLSGAAEQTISLEYGWVNLNTSEAESRVRTPRAEAVVAKQTDASVVYDEEAGKTRFAAYDGEVAVTTDDGEKKTISSMQQVVQRDEGLLGPTAVLRAPLLLGPGNNHDTGLREVQIVLSWDPVAGATGYALQVSSNSLFVENLIDVEKRQSTRATIGLRGDGNFHWHVAAHGSDGELGEWSEPRKFRVDGRSVSVEPRQGS